MLLRIGSKGVWMQCPTKYLAFGRENHFKPRPQNWISWYLLRAPFKMSDEHPRAFDMGVPPGKHTLLVTEFYSLTA